MDFIKKILNFLSMLPAFTNLFKKASQTGKIDPVDTLEALSNISPSTKKIADTAMTTINRGGNISDVANALTNIGEVEVAGQKINTKTMIGDLEKAGGICSFIANLLKKIPNQSVSETVNLGTAMTNVENWKDIVKQ